MISSTLVNTFIDHNSGLLKKQITENSKKIDQYLLELKELERRICGKDMIKSVA